MVTGSEAQRSTTHEPAAAAAWMRRLPGVRPAGAARAGRRGGDSSSCGPAREDILNWNYSTGILRLTSCAYLRSNPPAMRAPPRPRCALRAARARASSARWSCIAPTGRGARAGLARPRPAPAALVRGALARAGSQPRDIHGWPTRRPGPHRCLAHRGSLARSLAYAWGVPAIGVHHLEDICWRRCWKRIRPRSRIWRCWCPAGIRC